MKKENRYITGAILKNPNFLLKNLESAQVFKNTRGSLSWSIWRRKIRRYICSVASTVLESTSVCQHWGHEPGSVYLCLWQESHEDSSFSSPTWTESFFFFQVPPSWAYKPVAWVHSKDILMLSRLHHSRPSPELLKATAQNYTLTPLSHFQFWALCLHQDGIQQVSLPADLLM